MMKKQEEKNYTYMVECKDGSLYTGWTNDLSKRMKAHNQGKGAKYTSTRRPVILRYYEVHDTKQEAMSREYHIKQLKRAEKDALIAGFLLDEEYIRMNEGFISEHKNSCGDKE